VIELERTRGALGLKVGASVGGRVGRWEGEREGGREGRREGPWLGAGGLTEPSWAPS
jgi:hypothetical protein